IEVLDWGMSPLTGVGHWIYVRLLNFENSSPWAEVNFTVNVNMDAYTAWYNSDPDPFNGNQPPNTTGSSSAGTCEADWSQGCTGSNCGSSGTPTNTCDQSGAITCQFGGGVWDVTNCTCSTGGGNTGGNTGGTTGGNVSVSITNPTHNQTVSGTVIFRSSPLSEEEGVDIASVLFKVDGSPVATAVTSPPFNQAFDTTTISDGSHSLTATATDTNGESTTSGTYSFNVANGGSGSGSESPTVELTSPANGDALSGAMVMMMANADDDVAVAGVQFQVDGQNAGAEDVSSPYRVNLDTTTLSNGTHVVTAIARDGDGNATTSEGATVSVNNGSSGVSDPDPDQVFTAELFPIANWRIVHVGDVAAPVAPTLEFPEGLEGRYDCFAVYAQDGDLYLAEPNIAGAMVFRRFRDGDNIKYFERKTFHGETSWTPGVFSSLPTPNMEIIESRGVLFLLAVAPVEGGPLEGVIFTFRK
ncbi:MAG: hypothetical protein GY859_26205, partial [Desulfobacterales bacterium]|nr:hypothetical protein [Desulfobacterales bacterium]